MVIGSPVALPSDPELATRWLVDSVQTRQTGLTRSCRCSGEIVKVSPLREWPVLFAEQSILI